jgi:uncharacterized protein YbbC (DUF1343 family)
MSKLTPLLLVALLAGTCRSQVLLGIDVLQRDGCPALAGKRVGLVTNHTGRDSRGTPTIDVLAAAKSCQLVALFSPEHGIRGSLDEHVADGRDEKTGLPVWSLYGKTRKPTEKQLEGIDALVYDVQDIGTRFYTYISTLRLCLEAAGEHKLPIVVLDRPNPIDGVHVEGPIRDEGAESFTATHRLPVRHGMTVGELATLFVAERKIPVELVVVRMQGWRRAMRWDATGLEWRNPSPNMRSLTEAMLYPGIGLLETTNVSVGRGTDTPFEVLGAPWCDGKALAAELLRMAPPGVTFVPVRFTPNASKHAGVECGGVQIAIVDWARFEPVTVGIAIALALRATQERWQDEHFSKLLAHEPTLLAVRGRQPLAAIVASWRDELGGFSARRERHLLYRETSK